MGRPKQSTRFAAGVVPVRYQGEIPTLLLLRAYRLWDFPKGEPVPGEEPMVTACRELREETGLHHTDFRWGTEFCETEPYANGKVARYYLAVCSNGEVSLPENPQLGRPEHHEFRWATLEEATSLIPERLRPILTWVSQRLKR